MDWLKNKKYIYIVIGICIVIICIIACFIFESHNKSEDKNSIEDNIEIEQKTEEVETKKEIIVHIAGEVNNPGIIKIKEGSRIIDVVNMAGGFTNEADTDKVNFAYEVKDEQKIVIPNVNKKEEETKIIDEDESFIEGGSSNSSMVNINTATQSELESLTGIGPSMASKIIDYREKNGKFKSKDELKNVPGMGKSKYESNKEEVCVK